MVLRDGGVRGSVSEYESEVGADAEAGSKRRSECFGFQAVLDDMMFWVVSGRCRTVGRDICHKWTDAYLYFYQESRAQDNVEIARETDPDCLKGTCCLTKDIEIKVSMNSVRT